MRAGSPGWPGREARRGDGPFLMELRRGAPNAREEVARCAALIVHVAPCRAGRGPAAARWLRGFFHVPRAYARGYDLSRLRRSAW